MVYVLAKISIISYHSDQSAAQKVVSRNPPDYSVLSFKPSPALLYVPLVKSNAQKGTTIQAL